MTDRAGTVAVFLNYCTPEATIRAVQSLAESAPRVPVVIVDNASHDGSVEILSRALPDADLLVTSANLGYSGGCNLGIGRALASGARRVLLLNSDVIVLPGMVEALENALDASAHIGIAGPVVVDGANRERIQSAGIRYRSGTGRMRHIAYRHPRRRDDWSGSRRVNGVSGCAMLVDSRVFAAIGVFAEEFFFGYEDLDFCLRARETGFATVCVAAATVAHDGNLSIGRNSARRVYFGVRNHLLLASRHPRQRRLLMRSFTATSIVMLTIAFAMRGSGVKRAAAARAIVAGVRDHIEGRYGSGSSGSLESGR